MFFIRLSLSSNFWSWFFSLSSHIRPSSSFNRERTKWYTPHLQTISSKARWPLSLEAQAAWVRPLQSSPLWSCWSLSFFWWLVVLIVGGWLILVYGSRLIGLWVVGVRLGCGCEICGCGVWRGLTSTAVDIGCGGWCCDFFFFFFFGCRGWYWL